MKKRKSVMPLIMLVYAAVFAALLGVGLNLFTNYIADYERSRPDNIVKSWRDNMDEADVEPMMEALLSSLDNDIYPAEESRAQILELFFDSRTVRVPTETTEDVKAYVLKNGELVLGKVYFNASGKSSYGFNEYEVRTESVDLSHLAASQRICIPDSWSVSVNGFTLDESYIVERREFELYEEFYGNDELELPMLCEYETGLYLNEPEIVVKDEKGKKQTVLNEDSFADNCPQDVKDRISEEAQVFIELYIAYSSNVNGVTYGNYWRLSQHIIPGSSLQQRMHDAAGSLYWAQSKGEKLLGIDYHHFTDLGDGMYFCDLTYTNRTLGHKGYVEIENNLKFIFAEQEDGSFLAAAMTSY